jgi:hypothetical protein
MRSVVKGWRAVKGAGAERSRGCEEVSTTHAGSRLGAGGSGGVGWCWGARLLAVGGGALQLDGPLAADDEAGCCCS